MATPGVEDLPVHLALLDESDELGLWGTDAPRRRAFLPICVVPVDTRLCHLMPSDHGVPEIVGEDDLCLHYAQFGLILIVPGHFLRFGGEVARIGCEGEPPSSTRRVTGRARK